MHQRLISDLQDRLASKNLTEYKDLKREEHEATPERRKEEKQKYVPLDEAPIEDVRNAFEGTKEE